VVILTNPSTTPEAPHSQKEGELFSEKIRAGNRTYFFDAKKAANGKPYVKFTESKWSSKDETRTRSQLMVFEDDLEKFAKAFARVFRTVNNPR
jgi:hypothetical protein